MEDVIEIAPISVGDVFPELTLRERKVCALTVQGMSTKEVAMSLGISHRTVEDYRMEIYRKTGLKTMMHVTFRVFGSQKVVA
jgi:DNA-binding CsgD family transcriptional regulator